MVTVFDHPSYRNDCNPSIRPQKPIRQTVRGTRTRTRACVFLSLFSPPPPSSSSPPPLFLPLPRFLIHLHSMRGVYLSVIVVDIFINIYDNVAIFTFTTSFVWLKCFVPMIYVPGNIYSYLLSTASVSVQKRVKSRVIYVFLRKLNKFNLNLLSRFKLIELFRVYS